MTNKHIIVKEKEKKKGVSHYHYLFISFSLRRENAGLEPFVDLQRPPHPKRLGQKKKKEGMRGKSISFDSPVVCD